MDVRTRRRLARTMSRQAGAKAARSVAVGFVVDGSGSGEDVEGVIPDVMRAASREPKTAEKSVRRKAMSSMLRASASSAARS